MGLGKELLNSFYNELFRRGYASVTSAIFEFNKPSLKLHEKVAEFNGTRIDSYFINGRLWDMNFYSKVNPELERIIDLSEPELTLIKLQFSKL